MKGILGKIIVISIVLSMTGMAFVSLSENYSETENRDLQETVVTTIEPDQSDFTPEETRPEKPEDSYSVEITSVEDVEDESKYDDVKISDKPGIEVVDIDDIKDEIDLDMLEQNGAPDVQEEDESQSGAPMTYSSSKTLQYVFGTESSSKPGNGNGYIYRSGTIYRCYDGYYMYNYQSGTNYKYRGWAVYDMSALSQYQGAKITSAKIVFRQDYRYYISQLEFWSMTSYPYDGGSSTDSKKWYDEIGGTGSTKLGTLNFTGNSNTNNFDHEITMTSGGVKWLNDKLSSSNFDVSLGGDITKLVSSYTYGYIYCYDARLVVDFTCTSMPSDREGELVMGDDECGYAYSTSLYDIGRLYSSTSAGSYAVWNATRLKSLIPEKGPNGEEVTLESIGVRLNSPYGYNGRNAIYNMSNDPRTATASTIYSDARGGTRYYYNSSTASYVSTPRELEYPLGPDALDDFNDTLDGNPDYFALGFTSTSNYLYMYSPKLVLKWSIDLEMETSAVILGADNPEKAGQAHGYTRKSGNSHYSYTYYYAYTYKSSSSDYRGWATFDLADLEPWENATVKSAKLVIQNYYRYYLKEVGFTALKTTPYYASSNSVMAKNVYTESGSGGTQIGTYTATTASDTNTYNTLEIPLNSAAVDAIQDEIDGTATYKTFGIGMHVKSLWGTYTYGYARWTDIRLAVTMDYTALNNDTTGGSGSAFGDDISGHIYSYSSAYDRPYGYSYFRKTTSSEYRGYFQWDVDDIRDALPYEKYENVDVKKVGLRFNHRYSSLSGINVHDLINDVKTATAANIYTDCANGTKYYGPGSVGSTYNEYEWDLGSTAVTDFREVLYDPTISYFGVGLSTTSTSGYSYDFSPRLVVEWTYSDIDMKVMLENETSYGYEGSPVYFNANATLNMSGGNGNMLFEWDWESDGVYDDNSTSPYANHTWNDDFDGYLTLQVTDMTYDFNVSEQFAVIIENVDPEVDTTNGQLSPEPCYEGDMITFSGFTVDDPGNDTFTYLWDFDDDGVFDANGSCIGSSVPSETWTYYDDYNSTSSLVILDEDGGTTNITNSYSINATPANLGTGYVYYYGAKYTSNSIYYRWLYTYTYQRGWAKIGLPSIPGGAEITKLTLHANVLYQYGIFSKVGVRLLESDPTSAGGSTVFSEAGSGTSLGIISASTGTKSLDLTGWATGVGKTVFENATSDGWLGLGFNLSDTQNSYMYGYLQGYSNNQPYLSIEYNTYRPGCLIPMDVLNVAPTAEAGPDQSVWPEETLNFSGSCTDPGTLDTHTFEWDFGDGNTSSGQSCSYKYTMPGTFMVTLTVTDDDGGEGTDTLMVKIKAVNATIDYDPDTLNPKSNGKWTTCYIELEDGYDLKDIDVKSILLNRKIPAENAPMSYNDYDKDGIPDLMVKFDRSDVIDLLEPGKEVTIEIIGKVGTKYFLGTCTIRVPDK